MYIVSGNIESKKFRTKAMATSYINDMIIDLKDKNLGYDCEIKTSKENGLEFIKIVFDTFPCQESYNFIISKL